MKYANQPILPILLEGLDRRLFASIRLSFGAVLGLVGPGARLVRSTSADTLGLVGTFIGFRGFSPKRFYFVGL